jgi:hypothetical protein
VVGVEGEDAKRLERLSEARGKYAAAVVSELLREPSPPPRSGIRSRPSTGAGTDLGEAIVHDGAWVSSGAVDDSDRREAEALGLGGPLPDYRPGDSVTPIYDPYASGTGNGRSRLLDDWSRRPMSFSPGGGHIG